MINSKRIKKVFFLILTVLFLGIGISYAKEIEITSPQNGTSVNVRDIVIIDFVISYNKFTQIFFIAPENCAELTTGMGSYNIKIPNKLGEYPILIVGETYSGELLQESIKLNVKTQADLDSISIDPEEIFFDYPEDKIQLIVTGNYTNGEAHSVTSSQTGTTYVSSDVSIATIEEKGIVTAKGVGNCSITVSNDDKSINIPVTVFESKTIPAEIKPSPDILYTLRPEQILSCYIELPQQYNIQDIKPESILLNYRGKCDLGSIEYGDYNQNGIPELKIGFPTKEITPFLIPGDQSLVISGLVKEEYFRGRGNIKIIETIRAIPFKEFSLKHWRIHWDEGKHDKNKFQLSGRIDLPDDYTTDMLQKKGIVAIAIEKKNSSPFSQTATLDFKQRGPVWHYKAPKAQNGTFFEPLDIEKMLIFWQPEGLEGKPDKQGHAGKGHGKRAGWFMIQGNINISDTDQAALLPQAALTLNIPVENITTAGALESREEIEFKVHKNLWSYNAAPHNRWQDWQESWWEKVKED